MTEFDDPFGTPSAPVQAAPASLPPTAVEPATASGLPEAAFSFTVKSPRGNLFSIRGASAAEFAQNLQAAEGLIPAVAALESTATPARTAPAAAPQAQAYTQPPVQPQAAFSQPAADPNTPNCVHGPRVYKSGVSKTTGRPYSLWSCPMPQGPDQCKAIFG